MSGRFSGNAGRIVVPTSGWALAGFIVGLITLVGVIVVGAVIGAKVYQTAGDVSFVRDSTVDTLAPAPLGPACGTDVHAVPRREAAYSLRNERSFANYARPVPCHTNNGDEALYAPVYFASFSKGMPHDSLGHVDPTAYEKLLKAASSWVPGDFDAIPQAPGSVRDFTNPQAGLGYVLQGADGHSFFQPPAPAFASAEQAGEIVELYWMWYLRDVPFALYPTSARAIEAAGSLGALTDFRGLKPVTPANLFRGLSPGCEVGPYISQFMYMTCNFGANSIDQTLTPPLPEQDFMTNWTTYLAQQRAQAVEGSIQYNATRRHIITGRDLAHWVHIDVLFQAYFTAMLVLLEKGAPLKPGIPYQSSELNQMGFGTFGGPDVSAFATISATGALKAVWFQKWLVHRRLRPEVFAARVHNQLTSVYSYPLHSDVTGATTILTHVFNQYGSYLLPQAFPEGSPLHPSYGAGHATVAGAAVTILKALFKEDWVLPNPVMPNPDDGGVTLVPLSPPASLTVGGELNKLANNVAIGRNLAGVHWRSDATASLFLGEQVAIELLKDLQKTYTEPFSGFTFTSFAGTVIQL